MTQFFVFIHKLPNCQRKKTITRQNPQDTQFHQYKQNRDTIYIEDFHTLFDHEITVLIVQNVLH